MQQAVIHVNMDIEVLNKVEALYNRLGTNFSEAIRMFAVQSINENGMPFAVKLKDKENVIKFGVAQGDFVVPDDIDFCNGEIEDIFGGNDETFA